VNRIDLDSREVVEELTVGRAPVGLTVGPAHDRIYVSNRGAGTLSVVGVADGVEWTQIRVGEGPGGVTVDPLDNRLLVANAGSATLTIAEDLLAGRPPTGAPPESSPLVGRPLPEFSLVDLRTGERRSSREWAARKYILNFFASW
jgi:YVTN family beta-propeller protein